MIQSDISRRIKLCANRIRCSDCNAASTDALFISKKEVVFRSSVFRTPGFPMIKVKDRLRLNSMKTIDTGMVLTRLCMRCGSTREVRIPNIRALGYG